MPSSSDRRAFDRRILSSSRSRGFGVSSLWLPSVVPLYSLSVRCMFLSPIALPWPRGLLWPAAPSDGRMLRERGEKTGFQDKSAARGRGLRRQEGGWEEGSGRSEIRRDRGLPERQKMSAKCRVRMGGGRNSGADGSECPDTEERRKREEERGWLGCLGIIPLPRIARPRQDFRLQPPEHQPSCRRAQTGSACPPAPARPTGSLSGPVR